MSVAEVLAALYTNAGSDADQAVGSLSPTCRLIQVHEEPLLKAGYLPGHAQAVRDDSNSDERAAAAARYAARYWPGA